MHYLKLEDENTFHIILAFKGNEKSICREVIDQIMKNAKFRRVVIHVISPYESPFYIEKIREIITNNIAFTLICRYHGKTARDLLKLLKELRGKPFVIVIDPSAKEYITALAMVETKIVKIEGGEVICAVMKS